MGDITTWTFLRPSWLFLLVLLPVVGWWLTRMFAGSRSDWAAVVDEELFVAQVSAPTRWPRVAKWLALVALMLAILALAGLSTHKSTTPHSSEVQTYLFALDISRSMNANDIVPSRLVAAQQVVHDSLKTLSNARAGLVVYAGDAWMVAPITQDKKTLASLLEIVDTSLAPLQGSRPDLALTLALKLIDRATIAHAHIVLFSDGFRGDKAFDIARRVRDRGHRLTVIASGTPEGSRIPLAQGGYLRNFSGETVVSRVDEARMQELASAADGNLVWLSDGVVSLTGSTPSAYQSAVDGQPPVSLNRSTSHQDAVTVTAEDDGVWLVLPLLLLGALVFRRGVLLMFPVVVLLQPTPVFADGSGWWWRNDQRVVRAVERGDLDTAFRLAPDGEWLGIVSYRRGDYTGATVFFGGSDTADGHYNRGNALVKQERFEEALAAYNMALRRDPEHEDALYNRDLVNAFVDEQRERDQPGSDALLEDGSAPETTANQGDDNSTEESDETSSSSGTEDSDDQADSDRSPDASAESVDAQDLRAPSYTEVETISATDLDTWLTRIPDDPGGWLRRRFSRTQQQRDRPSPSGNTDAW